MPLLSIPFKIVVGKSSKNPKVAHFFSKTDTPSCTMHNLVTSKHHDSIVVVIVITLGTLLQWTKNSSKGSSSWSDPSFHFILEQAYPSLSLCDFDGSVAVNPNCPQMLGNSSVSLIMVIGRRERELRRREHFQVIFFWLLSLSDVSSSRPGGADTSRWGALWYTAAAAAEQNSVWIYIFRGLALSSYAVMPSWLRACIWIVFI